MRSQIDLQTQLTANAEKMNSIELARNQALLDRNKLMQEENAFAAKRLQDAQNARGSAVFNAIANSEAQGRSAISSYAAISSKNMP
jgi:hypothetical protein